MNKPKPFVGLKKRLGINSPGITIAVVALVLSLTGGAFAAAGLTTSEKKQVKSIAKAEAKKYAGKPGAQGAAGPAGAKGDKGDQGQQGSAGKEGLEGLEGLEGPEGPEGEGVALTPILKEDPGTCEEQGEEGGVEVRLKKQLAGQGSEVCNGKTGEKGEKGEPWTPNNTLPPGAVETGTWSLTGNTADTSGVRVPLTFFIKLETDPTSGVQLDFEHVHFQANETEEEFKASCEKGAGNPTPLPGHLCVYVNANDPVTGTVFKGILLPSFTIVEDLPEIEEGAGRAGAILYFAAPTGVATGSGTYAVRAPLAP